MEPYMPKVIHKGNPRNDDRVVATPMYELSRSAATQQWNCVIVLFDPKPLKFALMVSVKAIGSSTIVARPVPCEALEGFSFAPERFAKKVIGAAWAAGAGRMSTDAN